MSDQERRVMGLDVGDRTVGVALSDPSSTIATGLMTLRRTSLSEDLASLAKLVDMHQVSTIVAGWPLTFDGKPGAQAFKVARFLDALSAHLGGRDIVRWDERLSTVAALRALREGGVKGQKQREVVDKVAATLILQSWLDAQAGQLG